MVNQKLPSAPKGFKWFKPAPNLPAGLVPDKANTPPRQTTRGGSSGGSRTTPSKPSIPLTTFVPITPGAPTRSVPTLAKDRVSSPNLARTTPTPTLRTATTTARAPRLGDRYTGELGEQYVYALTSTGARYIPVKEAGTIPKLVGLGALGSLSLGGFGTIGQGVAPLITRFTPTQTTGFRPVQELAPQLTTKVKAQVASRTFFREYFFTPQTQAGLGVTSVVAPRVGEESVLVFQNKQVRNAYDTAITQTFREARNERSAGGAFLTEFEGIGRVRERERFQEKLKSQLEARGIIGTAQEKALRSGLIAYDRGAGGEAIGAGISSTQAEILGQSLFRRASRSQAGTTTTLPALRRDVFFRAFPNIGVAGAYEALTGSVRQQLSRERRVDFKETATDTAIGAGFAGLIGTGVSMAGVPTSAGVRRAIQSGKKVRGTGAGTASLLAVYVVDPYEPIGDFFGTQAFKGAGIPEPSFNIRVATSPSIQATMSGTGKQSVGTGKVQPSSVTDILNLAPAVRTEAPTIIQTPTQPSTPTTPTTPTNVFFTNPTRRTTPTTPSTPTGRSPTTINPNIPINPTIPVAPTTPVPITTFSVPITTATPMPRVPFFPPLFPPGELGGLGRGKRGSRTRFVNELEFGLGFFQGTTSRLRGSGFNTTFNPLIGGSGRSPLKSIPQVRTKPKRIKVSKKKSKKKEEEKKGNKVFWRGLI